MQARQLHSILFVVFSAYLQQKIITIQSWLDTDQAWELELEQLYPDIAAAD